MSEAVTIRPATHEDLAPMAELPGTLFSQKEDVTFNAVRVRSGLERLSASEQARALMAEADGNVVGMCSGQLTISTAKGGPAVLVEDGVFRQDRRGQGIGKRRINTRPLWHKTHEADHFKTPAITFNNHLGWTTTRLTCLRQQTI